jgi:hypothetical protein
MMVHLKNFNEKARSNYENFSIKVRITLPAPDVPDAGSEACRVLPG